MTNPVLGLVAFDDGHLMIVRNRRGASLDEFVANWDGSFTRDRKLVAVTKGDSDTLGNHLYRIEEQPQVRYRISDDRYKA